MSIVKRIAVDNKFMVRELNDCLPELKKLCPASYNGQTPKNSLSYNVGRLVKKGLLIRCGGGQYEVAIDR